MQRRDFIRACGVSTLATALPCPAADAKPSFYTRTRLEDLHGVPVKSRALAANRNFIFHYPFAATPCFLLNLGKPTKPMAALRTADAKTYQWQGGVGATRSIVAYSAICAHRLSYPTREISFISYSPDAMQHNGHAQTIHCCSEHSQYDPYEGAKVIAGPAPQPLATILLDYDAASDELYTVGTLGGEMFNEFFKRFEFRLSMEYGGRARQVVQGACVVRELTQFCKQQVKC